MYDFSDFISPDEDAVHAAPAIDERSIGRRIALQALYEIDLAQHPPGDVLSRLMQAQKPSETAGRFAQTLVNGVLEQKARVDSAIRHFAPEYPLEQIAVIDRNILRIAILEFAVRARTPIGVAIDEAVELAKLFGADGAPSFVNGVLGSIADSAHWLNQLKLAEPNTKPAEESEESKPHATES